MSIDPLAFLDQPQTQTEKTSSDPLNFLDQRSTSPFRKPARHLAQGVKGSLNLIPGVAGYNLLTTAVPAGAHKSRMRVSEQAQKDLAMMDEKLARGEPLTRLEKIHYEKTKQLAERKSEKAASLDTESLINKGVKAATGIDLEPEDLGEELTNIGASLFSPRGLVKAAQTLPKLATKTGRAALSAERAIAKTKSGWESLEKAFKSNPEKQAIVNWANQKGLTPREATLLVQSESKVGKLGKVAKKTKQFEKDVSGLREKLGASYEDLKAIKGRGGTLNTRGVRSLADDLRKMSSDMDKTLIKGPDTKAAQSAIEEALLKLEMNGATVGDLVNTRMNLGQQINWKNIDPKGAMLNEGRRIFLKAIEKTNPQAANEIRFTDKAWSKYQKFADILDKKQATFSVKGIPVPTGSIAFGIGLKAALGLSPATAVKFALAKEAVQRFSTAMLTNPKLQGVHKRLVQAMLSGSEENQRKLMVVAQNILKKEDPELYDELGLD